MKSITFIASLGVLVLGACSDRTNLPVRHGPQAIHPAEYARTSTPIERASVSTASFETNVPSPSVTTDLYEPTPTVAASFVQDDACGASQYQYLVGQDSQVLGAIDVPDATRNFGSNDAVTTEDPTRLNFVHSGNSVVDLLFSRSQVKRVFCG